MYLVCAGDGPPQANCMVLCSQASPLRSKFDIYTRYFYFKNVFVMFWLFLVIFEVRRGSRCSYTRSDQFSAQTDRGRASYEQETFQVNENQINGIKFQAYSMVLCSQASPISIYDLVIRKKDFGDFYQRSLYSIHICIYIYTHTHIYFF